MSDVRQSIQKLKQAMDGAVLGQPQMVDTLLIALLTNGNVLLEGLPGTAKTRSIKALARALDVSLGRVQFTPDLLPSDITGTEVYQEVAGSHKLTFQPGPVFNNFLLADEINRSPAKVQAALLEAMEERQVTVAGHTHALPDLFMVLATQNPIEQEGTYRLPEAQMDRFLIKIDLGYPDHETEARIVDLVHQESKHTIERQPVEPAVIFTAREQVREVFRSEAVLNYMVSIVMATRQPQRFADSPLTDWIQVGASPRATIALDQCARAHAWLQGKAFVDPDDVREVVHAVLRHRITLSYDAQAEGVTADQVIGELLRQVIAA